MAHVTGYTTILSKALYLGAVALIASFGLSGISASVSAQEFLEGQSKGMNKCVRAILRGHTVKRVNVHGHHFNCLPLKRFEGGRRVISVDNNRRGRMDHSFRVIFFVNRVGTREYIRNNSAKVRIIRTKDILDIFPPYRFRGPPGRRREARDYDSYVRSAREIQPREVEDWEDAARQIATIVIATLGEPWP